MAAAGKEEKHTFVNGDVYCGDVKSDLPHGFGRYDWSDGSYYEGQWKSGLKNGHGKYRWTSGSSYEGEWVEGCMHGTGTYVGSDESEYHGSFIKDKKSGYGKKKYPNGDTYEGLWKDDLASSLGIYEWSNGDKYNGEWQGGKMHGQGTFVWNTGERYEGDWNEGMEHGPGLFIWADGSAFYGFWDRGKKHGVGAWWRGHRELHEIGVPSTPGKTPRTPGRAAPSEPGEPGEGSGPPQSDKLSMALQENKVIVREYDHGKLVREQWVPKDEVELPSLRATKKPAAKTKKYSKKVQGETIVKGHRSYDLMLNLQLGIRYSVGKVNEEQRAELHSRDFDKTQDRQVFFPHNGSSDTPPHSSTDFYWKTYCPRVFRQCRDRFGCDPGEYVMSLCGDQALRELSSPGKSGSVFYISDDDQYLCKSLRKGELKFFCKMLPEYYQHVMTNKCTLLPKLYGLHRITNPQKAQRVRFVVMANVFCTDTHIHRKFDLKGSTVGRETSDIGEDTILKDLDIDCTFKLEKKWRSVFFKQLEEDCKFLEKMNIMDYSILLGVHYTDEGKAGVDTITEEDDEESEGEGSRGGDGATSLTPMGTSQGEARKGATMPLNFARSLKELNKLANSRKKTTTTSEIFKTRPMRSDTLRPVTDGLEQMSLAMGIDFNIELGVNMPATVIPDDPSKGEPRDAVLYFGIIDILQDYNLKKQLENVSKGVVFDRHGISAVSPKEYSRRLQNFMKEKFV